MTQQYLLRMNDGRQFTDYTPRGSVPLPTTRVPAHVSKNAMISQADDLMARDRSAAAASVGFDLTDAATLVTVPGFEVTQAFDNRSCSFASTIPIPGQPDNTGVGTKAHAAAPLP